MSKEWYVVVVVVVVFNKYLLGITVTAALGAAFSLPIVMRASNGGENAKSANVLLITMTRFGCRFRGNEFNCRYERYRLFSNYVKN